MISWVPEGHAVVMEKFGKYSETIESGFYMYIPFVYTPKMLYNWGNIAQKGGYMIEKSEQQTTTPSRSCQTKDNVTIKANASIGWKIIDPKKAVYAADRLPAMIADLALNNLRANIGTLSFNEVFSSRVELNNKINSELSDTVYKWGIELLRVEIQELTYSEAIAKAMMTEMIATRERTAKISLAEGESQAKVMNAEADAKAAELIATSDARAIVLEAEAKAKATQLRADSESEYLAKLSEKVSPELAAKLLEAEKNRQTMEIMTLNPSHKVFLPADTKATIMTNV